MLTSKQQTSAVQRTPKRFYLKWAGLGVAILGFLVGIVGNNFFLFWFGLVIFLLQFLFKTTSVVCPACGQQTKVEKSVKIFACRHCGTRLTNKSGTWEQINAPSA